MEPPPHLGPSSTRQATCWSATCSTSTPRIPSRADIDITVTAVFKNIERRARKVVDSQGRFGPARSVQDASARLRRHRGQQARTRIVRRIVRHSLPVRGRGASCGSRRLDRGDRGARARGQAPPPSPGARTREDGRTRSLSTDKEKAVCDGNRRRPNRGFVQ
jgi:hypothetical protein